MKAADTCLLAAADKTRASMVDGGGILEQARDVVQETFIRLCAEKPERVESHLTQWLFTVCRNLAIDGQRKRGRMTRLVSWLVSGEDRVGLMGRLGTGLAVVMAMLFCVDLAPTWVKIDVQTFLQKATAGSAYGMMKLAGTTVFKNGPVLNFPEGTRPGGKSLMAELACAPINWDLLAVAARFSFCFRLFHLCSFCGG